VAEGVGGVFPDVRVRVGQRGDEGADSQLAEGGEGVGQGVPLESVTVAEPGGERLHHRLAARVGRGTVGLDGDVRVRVGHERDHVRSVGGIAHLAEHVGGLPPLGGKLAAEEVENVRQGGVDQLDGRPGEVLPDAGVLLDAQAGDERRSGDRVAGRAECQGGAATGSEVGMDEVRDEHLRRGQ